jgi:hypothetical protein
MMEGERIPAVYIVRLGPQVVAGFSTLEEARAFTRKQPELRYTIYEDNTFIEMTGPPISSDT